MKRIEANDLPSQIFKITKVNRLEKEDQVFEAEFSNGYLKALRFGNFKKI